jgi:response regulator RpfG family c-di-GMP phosphodiesterase
MVPAPDPARKQRVLLVDDEPDILESLQELLEASLPTVEVRTALSGPKALMELRKDRIDLIVADYKMPEMNGLEFLKKADEVAPGIPRILITAFPDLEIAIKAINDARIENFFTKPFEPNEVVGAIRSVLFDRKVKQLSNETLANVLAAQRGPIPKKDKE